MENISNFLKACRAFGVPEHDLFETVDLYDEKDMNVVLVCLLSLSRNIQRTVPTFTGPFIGPGGGAGVGAAQAAAAPVLAAAVASPPPAVMRSSTNSMFSSGSSSSDSSGSNNTALPKTLLESIKACTITEPSRPPPPPARATATATATATTATTVGAAAATTAKSPVGARGAG